MTPTTETHYPLLQYHYKVILHVLLAVLHSNLLSRVDWQGFHVSKILIHVAGEELPMCCTLCF